MNQQQSGQKGKGNTASQMSAVPLRLTRYFASRSAFILASLHFALLHLTHTRLLITRFLALFSPEGIAIDSGFLVTFKGEA